MDSTSLQNFITFYTKAFEKNPPKVHIFRNSHFYGQFIYSIYLTDTSTNKLVQKKCCTLSVRIQMYVKPKKVKYLYTVSF